MAEVFDRKCGPVGAEEEGREHRGAEHRKLSFVDRGILVWNSGEGVTREDGKVCMIEREEKTKMTDTH